MIPTAWAHNSSIRQRQPDRNFYNSYSDRSSASFLQAEYRDGPDFLRRHTLRHTGLSFLRPRSPPPPVMRDKYYLESNMGSPSALDARAGEEKAMDPATASSKITHHNGVMYETTAEGDVAVVQPSFDDHDGRSPGAEVGKPSTDGETRSPPLKDIPSRRGHTRNLSEHFQDATTLSTDPTVAASSAAGQKHRRGYSGGVSNPAQAHRRIDSIGNSAMVKRGGARDHRRIDSSGLDALTAAADFSREELAAAASGGRNVSWDPSGIRRSPIEIASYEHAKRGPPQQSSLAHHRHYPAGGPPPGAYYGPPPPYHHGSYPPTYFSHPTHGYGRPQPHSDRYPVQCARGEDTYAKQHLPLQQPVLERPQADSAVGRSSPTVSSIDHHASANARAPPQTAPVSNEGMHPPAPPSWRGGSSQGVQTYVTAIGVGNTSRTVEANPQLVPTATGPREGLSAMNGHHRKLSSFSNLAPLLFGDPGAEHPLKRGAAHHRSTSSTVSFLQALDVNFDMNTTDAAFLRNIHANTGAPPAALNSNSLKADAAPTSGAVSTGGGKVDSSTKLAAGGTSKRVRRKCSVGNCDNRVVQGGLCIAHGAKRKQCKHPGCTKHVKKAGLCSTHGPARKRCETDGCTKVAVQGGRCIAHGAKKRTCSVDECTKQAILSGMCKKHHDQNQRNLNPVGSTGRSGVCQVVESKKSAQSPYAKKAGSASKKPTHTRGLSIFQEISADSVGDLLSSSAAAAAPNGAAAAPSPTLAPPSHRHSSTFSRDFGSIY